MAALTLAPHRAGLPENADAAAAMLDAMLAREDATVAAAAQVEAWVAEADPPPEPD
jgi:hypothetical protein